MFVSVVVFGGPLAPAPTDDDPHPLSGETLPVVFGHEFSGVVTEVADDVDHVTVGDHVVVEPLMVDDPWWACQQGHYNLCEQMGLIGISGRGGGMAQSVVVGGGGPIGQLVTAVLKAKGLHVIVSEDSAARQQVARNTGYADPTLWTLLRSPWLT